MKYLQSWLKDYYKSERSAEEIAGVLTRLGSEVESIESKDNDMVFDLEITPNHGDLLSHFGLARDLAAASGSELAKDKIDLKQSAQQASDTISVEIKSEKCPLYLARVIHGVKIAPSPDWLKERLAALGVKSINNVVDVTNYVMYDLGHPLHAFDAEKITGDSIIVREIESDEEIVTLDGVARELIEGMLVIADAERPVAIAGAMGLKNSEIDEQTTDIILEAAVFSRKSVRKTAKLLGIQTEASYRFERGVDDRGAEYAIDKAAKMISEFAGGEVLKGIVRAGENKKLGMVDIEDEKINRLIGGEIPKEKIGAILENLGFKVENSRAEVPSWRHDISIWQDLAEEVARVEGLEKIKSRPLPSAQMAAQSSEFYKREMIKDWLIELGLDEALNYTFLSGEDATAAKLDLKNLVEVANPIQPENRYLRNSLVSGLLKSIARNPSFDDIEFFEIGNVFGSSIKNKNTKEPTLSDQKGVEWVPENSERTNLAIATAGKSARKASKIVKILSEKLKVKSEKFRIYEIDREELKRFKIKKPSVSVAEVELTEILKNFRHPELDSGSKNKKEWMPNPACRQAWQVRHDGKATVQYRPVSKFPPVSRDLAFVVGGDVLVKDIRNSILDTCDKAVLAEVFDEFEDDRFGEGKKSVAFHIYLQDLEKTLSSGEADGEIAKIITALSEKFGAKLRV